MLPSLTPNRVVASAGAAPLSTPPPRFRPLLGPTNEIQLRAVPYRRAEGITGSQKAGLRYEEHVQNVLQTKFSNYMPGPYLHFKDRGVVRTAQPDGVLLFDDYLFIFEVKYTHCPEAWWQLEKLYAPLLRQLFPSRTVGLVEVCRSYDPSTPFPCAIECFDCIIEWCSRPRTQFGVWAWRR